MYIHVDTMRRLVYTGINNVGEKVMSGKTATLTVQKWGNSLAVRIPAIIARGAHFHLGTPVKLEVHDDSIIVRSTGQPKMTLEERLEKFDPKKHGGEVMVSGLIGSEKF